MTKDSPVETFFQEEVGRAFRERGLLAGAHGELRRPAAGPLCRDAPRRHPARLQDEGGPGDVGRERRNCLREIGDRSLFVSGFFAESLGRRLVDVDYYIEMGGAAYRALAGTERAYAAVGETFVGVFHELSERFENVVDALILISQRTSLQPKHTDLVRLVERWQRTGSRFTARRLAAAGVVLPTDKRVQ